MEGRGGLHARKVHPFGYVYLYLAMEETQKAQDLLVELESDIESLRYTYNGVPVFVISCWARIHELKENWSKALEYNLKLAELVPGHDYQPMSHGRCLRALGRLDEAETELNKALVRVPYNAEAHYEMALVMAATDRPDEARQHLEKGLVVWADAEPGFEKAQKARNALKELNETGVITAK